MSWVGGNLSLFNILQCSIKIRVLIWCLHYTTCNWKSPARSRTWHWWTWRFWSHQPKKWKISDLVQFLFQVRITDWIYQQLCHCTAPIHSVIPPLIEAFVTSIIVPATRADCTNEPISEDELLSVFQNPFHSRSTGMFNSQLENGSKSSFTTQILLVYYLLLYEDMLLSNMPSISKILFISYFLL